MQIERGDIYYCKIPKETVGCEQGGTRPGVVISNNTGNHFGEAVIVALITGRNHIRLPTHVFTDSTKYRSVVMCEQIRTVSKTRLIDKIGHVTPAEMASIDAALKVSLCLTFAGKENSQEAATSQES